MVPVQMAMACRNYNIIHDSSTGYGEDRRSEFRYKFSRSTDVYDCVSRGYIKFNNLRLSSVSLISISDTDTHGDNLRIILSSVATIRSTTVRIRLSSESGENVYYRVEADSRGHDGYHVFRVSYVRGDIEKLFEGDHISLCFEFDDLCFKYNYGGVTNPTGEPGVGNMSYITSGSSQVSMNNVDADGNDISHVLNLVSEMARRSGVVMKLSHWYNSRDQSYWRVSNGINNFSWHQLVISWRSGSSSSPNAPVRVCFKFDDYEPSDVSCTSVTMYSSSGGCGSCSDCFNRHCWKSEDGIHQCSDEYYRCLESNRCLLDVNPTGRCGDMIDNTPLADIRSSFRVYPDSNSFRVANDEPFKQMSHLSSVTPYIFVSEREALLVILAGPEVIARVRGFLERNSKVNYRPQKLTSSNLDEITISDIIHWKNLVPNRKLTVLFFDMSMKCKIGESQCHLELTPELALSVIDSYLR